MTLRNIVWATLNRYGSTNYGGYAMVQKGQNLLVQVVTGRYRSRWSTFLIRSVWLLVLPSIICLSARAESSPLTYAIPYLENIYIDGDLQDWQERGFRVEALTGEDGYIDRPADLNVRFRLGWNSEGLLVLVVVNDDEIKESPRDTWLILADCVQFYLGNLEPGHEAVRFDVAPGLDPDHPKLRYYAYDYNRTGPLAFEFRSAKMQKGYIVEALLPWKNLNIVPRRGREVGFQLHVIDGDSTTSGSQVHWYPLPMDVHYIDQTRLNRLHLADKPGSPIRVAAAASYDHYLNIHFGVTTSPALAGQRVVVMAGEKNLAEGVLELQEDQAILTLEVPRPQPGDPYGDLDVWVGGEYVHSIALENADAQRLVRFMETPLVARPHVFNTPDFPSCVFEQPFWMENLIGPYAIELSYYDRQYNPVRRADKPGRYGAVARIITADGQHFTRFLTLFRAPDGVHEWLGPSADRLPLNPQLGIDPAIAVEHDDLIRGFFNRTLQDGVAHAGDMAVLLAWLSETPPDQGPISTFNGPEAADRQWWVGLKRRLNGNDGRFSEPFVCPRPMETPSAPILREGTVQEAGFQADAIDEIDAVLQEWAAHSDQAFIACIARHGVIILHRAYGVRDGQPMTTETQSWMASLTKLLHGTLVMMAVDQGLIDLDASIDAYLPAFEGIRTETPATVRHLLTHTAGMWGHWGDECHDFEHRVAAYYPHLEIGRKHQYNGASLALGSKILEQVTGESLPQLYKSHLLDPLGCTHTEVSNSSYDARSTAIDMARIGQMLLNRGAYGDKRFFSESTFKQMLPQPLTQLLGPETTAEWGIGTIWFNMFFPSDGLSSQTFTHGSASNTRLLIDPENDLIISMTRNQDGRNFDKYASIFNRTVMENLLNSR